VTGSARPVPRGYELVRVLGEGGFGEVVLARQVALDRLVAIKRVHAFALGSADDLARFQREARVLASLDHPAVVRVLDYRLDDDTGAALVMEYVPGTNLHDLLENGPVPPAAALRILADVASALEAAAARGIVHRDIKSANVFVLPDGSAKLGDFGIARMLGDPAVFRTTDGSVRGTPGYMAPEAGLGGGEPDARSDAYAFAVLAFETLTGRLPFGDLDMAAALVAHWERPAPLASEVVPGFPPAAAEAIAAGLTKDPDARPTPSALVDRLAAVPIEQWPNAAGPDGAPIPAPPTVVGAAGQQGVAPPTVIGAGAAAPVAPRAPMPAPPTGKGRRRRRWLVPVAVVVCLAALGVAAWRLWPAGDPAALEVRDVVLSLDPPTGQSGCPTATYRVAAEVTTNGGPGELAFAWELPDGRHTAPDSVDVAAGQHEARLSLSFDLAGPPVTGPPVLVVSAPQESRTEGPPVRFQC
jgi:predicted Ser/Thr protein kinase